MNIERWRRIRELSEQAAARPAPERAQWLALVEPDAALRARALELADDDLALDEAQPHAWSPHAVAAAVEVVGEAEAAAEGVSRRGGEGELRGGRAGRRVSRRGGRGEEGGGGERGGEGAVHHGG